MAGDDYIFPLTIELFQETRAFKLTVDKTAHRLQCKYFGHVRYQLISHWVSTVHIMCTTTTIFFISFPENTWKIGF